MELPFTIKNKHRSTNLKFDFLKVPFWTPQKVCFWFLKKPPPQNFFFVYGFDSALKTTDAQMFFWPVFLKTHKTKVIDRQKRHFCCFWRLITVFCAFSKRLIRITFVGLLFLKLKQKKIWINNFFTVFISKLKNALFWGSIKKFWGFSSKTKNALFRGSKMVLFKSQISNLYFWVCSLM